MFGSWLVTNWGALRPIMGLVVLFIGEFLLLYKVSWLLSFLSWVNGISTLSFLTYLNLSGRSGILYLFFNYTVLAICITKLFRVDLVFFWTWSWVRRLPSEWAFRVLIRAEFLCWNICWYFWYCMIEVAGLFGSTLAFLNYSIICCCFAEKRLPTRDVWGWAGFCWFVTSRTKFLRWPVDGMLWW